MAVLGGAVVEQALIMGVFMYMSEPGIGVLNWLNLGGVFAHGCAAMGILLYGGFNPVVGDRVINKDTRESGRVAYTSSKSVRVQIRPKYNISDLLGKTREEINAMMQDRSNWINATWQKSDLDEGWEIQALHERYHVNATMDINQIFATLGSDGVETNMLPPINQRHGVALFGALTAMSHSFLWLNGNGMYKTWVYEYRQQPMRWAEYTVTSGIMMVLLSNSLNVMEYNDVLAVFLTTAVTNIFGYAIEQVDGNNEQAKWVFMGAGFALFLYAWSLVADRLFQMLELFAYLKEQFTEAADGVFSKEDLKEMEDNFEWNIRLLKVMCTGLSIAYYLFPAIQIGQILYPAKYALGEAMFILASCVSKIFLTVSAYFMGRRPNISRQGQGAGEGGEI